MSTDANPVFFSSGLACEIYSRGGPSLYICCVVSYHVIAVSCVRSGHCDLALLYSLVDDLEYTWKMS